MQLRVTHETRYAYTPAVQTAQHMAHLKPLDTGAQRLIEHTLQVRPLPDQRTDTRDLHGNSRTFFSLQSLHDRLVVTARSVVTTQEWAWPAADVAWERVQALYRYQAGCRWEPSSEFVFPSPLAPRHAELLDYARPSFPAGAPLLDAVADLTHRLHHDMRYDPDSTEVSTPALVALRQRRGVCQDFAHIGIACLRALGLPARYVSGYLLTQPPPGRPRLIGADASHAWLAVLLPAFADTDVTPMWCDFDPTNDRRAGCDYVTLAVGRDYADVPPIRGVLHGGARHTLKVAVTVEPWEEPAANPITER